MTITERIKEVKLSNRLLTLKQASEILGVNRGTLYQWKWWKRHLPFVKVGRSVRVSEKDLMEFIEKNREEPEVSP